MFWLVLSEILLFAIAILIGGVIGWALHAAFIASRRRALESDVVELRAALSEAQVRKARGL